MRSSRLRVPTALVLAMPLAACSSPSVTEYIDPVPTWISFSAPSLTIDDESGATLTARVVDHFGLPINGLPAERAIRWSVSDTGVARIADGVVSALRPGQTYVYAASGTLRDSASVTVRRVASRLEVVAGMDATGSALETLPEIAVAALDRFGETVVGTRMTFTILSGEGSLSAPQAITDTLGVARVHWTLGPRLGVQQVAATDGVDNPVSVLVTATAR